MGRVLERAISPSPTQTIDRPAWIPSHIINNWDPDPYAYQTEEDLMPVGGPHWETLNAIAEMLRYVMATRGWLLLSDVYLLYWNHHHERNRIAPDLMFVEKREPTPKSWDLDIEPRPSCVVEIISPSSRTQDLVDNPQLYIDHLWIPLYIVIDGVTEKGEAKDEIELHIWRLVNGQRQVVLPDSEGRYALPELDLWVTTVGRRICFGDAQSNQVLYDMEQAMAGLEIAEERAETEAQRAETETQRAEAAEERAKAEAQRAEAAEERAKTTEHRLEAEQERADIAEQDAKRFAEQLRKLGIDPASI